MSFLIAALLQAASAAAPAPQASQQSDPAIPSVEAAVPSRVVRGMPVFDTRGGLVGNVASISGDTLVVDTGTAKVAFAVSDFGMRSGSLVSSLTRADVEMLGAQVESEVAASRTPLLKVGVGVVGSDGAPIGTVVAVEPGFLVVGLLPSGLVKLPVHSFAGSGGSLVMATTLERLRRLIPSG